MSKILLLGAYGQGNLGDDLLLETYLNKLFYLLPNEKITVGVSERDLVNKKILLNKKVKIIELYKLNIFQKIKMIFETKIIIFGGGSILKELPKSSKRSKYSVLINTLLLVIIAKSIGKKVFFLNIGIGPIKTKVGKILSSVIIKLSDKIITRDVNSFNYAKNISKNKTINGVDGVFYNSNFKLQIKEKNKSNQIGINLNFSFPDNVDKLHIYDELIKMINKILSDKTKRITFLIFQSKFKEDNDLIIIKNELLPKIKQKNAIRIEIVTTNNFERVYHNLNLLICMRYHAAIIAISQLLPFVMISYDQKCSSLMKEINYPLALELKSFKNDIALKYIKTLSKNKTNTIKKISSIKYQLIHKSKNTLSVWEEIKNEIN